MTLEQVNRWMEMVQWLIDHPDLQRKLCRDEYQVDAEELLQILDVLEQKEYYEFMVVLLFKNETVRVIGQAITRFIAHKAIDCWKREGSAALKNQFQTYLQEEIRWDMEARRINSAEELL